MEDLISTGLDILGVPSGQSGLLAQYGELLLEQNQVMNLTAITDLHGVATLHMLDCAALVPLLGDTTGKTLIDVGTGAGFPGVVLKVLSPPLSVTLLDSLQKRLDWLEDVSNRLGLENIRTLHARGEEAGHETALREQFDFATARAVAELRVLCELCLPFLKVGGSFLAMKSVDDRELEESETAIRLLGGRLAGCHDYIIPHTGITHRVVMVEKVSPTPAKFPRRWARMQKSPL